MVRFLLLAVAGTMMASCGGANGLTEQEMAKLDIPLRMLLSGDTTHQGDLDASERPDGTTEYGAIVRTRDLTALRKVGVRVQSAFDDVVTIRGTADELRSVVALKSVYAVAAGNKNVVH